MPSKVAEGAERGWIVPIGGAEDKEANPKVLARFVEHCGGSEARIVVIPTASRLHETGNQYQRLFPELGAARVDVLDFDTRRDTQERSRLDLIEAATGIFFTGGNQLRLSTLLGGTPVAKLVRTMNAAGVTVGGTEGLNVWVPVHDETAAVVRLASQGIGVAAGSPFRVAGDEAGHVRVTVGLVREDVGDVAEALAAAAEAGTRASRAR